MVANFFLFWGFNIWRAIFNNFAVEELAVTPEQIGIIQSIREVPGLLGFVLGFLSLYVSEITLVGISVALLGLGLILTAFSYNLAWLIFSTLVMSVGFHFFFSANSSLILMLSGHRESAKVLGRFRSVNSLAAVTATLLIYLTVHRLGYRPVLILIGAIVILSSPIPLFKRRLQKADDLDRRVVFRKQYWLYYVLTFLMGSRRHIFTTFAVFLLVSVHGVSAEVIATLFLINGLITIYFYDQLGKLVARFGERKMLSFNFLSLFFIFLGYAFIRNLAVLFLLYVLDNIFFGFSVALQSYLRRLAPSEEITPNVSMGQTVNHVAALFMPVLGGFLWKLYGPSAPFLTGAAVVLLSLLLTQLIEERVTPAARPLC